jgi:hypothetical protein
LLPRGRGNNFWFNLLSSFIGITIVYFMAWWERNKPNRDKAKDLVSDFKDEIRPRDPRLKKAA